MTPEEQTKMRQLLETELQEAEQTMERLRESCQAVAPDNALGRITRMEIMSDQQMSKAKLAKMRERKHLLEDALRNVSTPGFGLCRVCNHPIPAERLLAVPEAKVCVPCLNRLQARAKGR